MDREQIKLELLKAIIPTASKAGIEKEDNSILNFAERCYKFIIEKDAGETSKKISQSGKNYNKS